MRNWRVTVDGHVYVVSASGVSSAVFKAVQGHKERGSKALDSANDIARQRTLHITVISNDIPVTR